MPELRVSAFVIPAISAVLGGIVASALTLTLQRPKPIGAQPERTTPVETAPPSDTRLDGRVAALERSLQALSLRDSMARAASKLDAVPVDSAGAKPIADVAPIVDNPVFEAAVRDVLDRAEQERTVEREAQRSEYRKQASEEWANGLGEKLRLTDAQKAKALAVATSFWEKLRDARQTDAGPPANRQELRARMDELRNAAEAELAQVLSPAQMNSYRELDEASRLGSRRSVRANERNGR